ANHAAEALHHDPEDTATRERLDRAHARLGQHEQRAKAWLAEAHADRPKDVRVAAFLRAADIAGRKLKRTDDATAHLKPAWTLDPGNPAAFEALSALLAPPPRDIDADLRGVRARLDLYSQAAHKAEDPARRVGLLEKVAAIWEDELGQPARAI